jgi:hypothetical protein
VESLEDNRLLQVRASAASERDVVGMYTGLDVTWDNFSPPTPPPPIASWRSNPTMDYNQQALYSGVIAANHVELAGAYYDFIDQAIASGSPAAESASLGCPGGLFFSVDLAPLGLKLGVWGEAQAWGIFSNAAYAAVLHAYHWSAVDHADPSVLAWASGHAVPFLEGIAAFWECHLTKVATPGAPDGYHYWSIGDCDGDENCDSSLSPEERTNPTWTLAYLQRLLETLVSMTAALDREPNAAWLDMLAHLPPVPTTVYEGVPVLSSYGEGANATEKTQAAWFTGKHQAGYLHSIWPGEVLSPMSEQNSTLVAAAQNTFKWAPWYQDNSFSWIFASAARAGIAPDVILGIWQPYLIRNMKTNRLVAFGGLCSDSLGAVAFVHDMLVQSQEGFLRLLPAWPANASASFESLRMRGALLVSASYVGRAEWAGLVAGRTGGTANVTITAEAGGVVSFLSPWPDSPTANVVVTDVTAGGGPINVTWTTLGGPFGGPIGNFTAARSHAYLIVST